MALSETDSLMLRRTHVRPQSLSFTRPETSNIWLHLTNGGAAHSVYPPLCLLSPFAAEPSVVLVCQNARDRSDLFSIQASR